MEELTARYDSRASFYGKAKTETTRTTYETTTTRHQKEFFKQHELTDNEIKMVMDFGTLEIEL